MQITAKADRIGLLLLGGDDRNRLCDPLRVKQVLYRLSYASIW